MTSIRMANPRIEIVEDEMLIARELEARLIDLGYDVPLIVATADEAVRAVGEVHPDLVMMDIVIQGERDGIEAAAEITRRYGIPVVYLTAYADAQTVERAKLTGPFGYIVKPFSVSDLRATVEMALYKGRMEAKLRSAERWLSATVRSVGEALIAVDNQQAVVQMNPVAEELTGWSQAEVVGRPIDLAVTVRDGETGASIVSPMAQALVTGAVARMARNTLLVARNGREVPVAGSASPILDDEGRLIGAVLVMRDISERRRGEQRQRILAESSEALAASLDYKATLAKVAQLAVPYLGRWCAIHLVEEYAALRPITLAQSERSLPPARTDEQVALDAADTGQGVLRVMAGSLRPALSTLSEAELQDPQFVQLIAEQAAYPALIVPLQTRGGALGTLTFIAANTERRYTADDLELAGELARRVALAVENAGLYRAAQELNDELEQRVTERTAALMAANEELGAFSSSVSHDLRTPLRHVAGFIGLLKEDSGQELNEQQRDYLDRALAASMRMSRMIDDLLAFSRLGRADLKKSRFEIGPLVQEVIADFEQDTQHRQIEWVLPPLPAVDADRSMLRLVWANLVSNALKYSGPRAQVRIEIGCTEHDEEQFFHIRDNGVGFDPQYADKLFGVFQRLHNAAEFEGTGIGLANVRRIIQRHGGTVWAVSAVGAGATFYFSLPRGGRGTVDGRQQVGAIPRGRPMDAR